MNMDELNNLDFTSIGSWPWPLKAILISLVSIIVPIAGYFLLIEEQWKTFHAVEQQEQTLRADFESKQERAANLDAYKIQLAKMDKSFGEMLKQLPDSTQVPGLLDDVSDSGRSSGLEFNLFQPTGEVPKGFYAELPIQLEVTGTYHEFGKFVSSLAGLPRIVTIHDMSIKQGRKARGAKEKDKGAVQGDTQLIMKATAKTYRYLEEKQ